MAIYKPWIWLYVLANAAAAWIMLETGELVGDVAGTRIYSTSAVVWAALLVILSYMVLLGPVFGHMAKIRFNRISFGPNRELLADRIGKLLIVLQIGYMAFNISHGVNVAGSGTSRASGFESLLWVLIPVDALFLIYYGFHRDNRHFWPNLALWLASNLLRGWSGVFLIIAFFEWCRAVRKGRMTLLRTLIGGLAILALYPALMNVKWLVRATAGGDMSLELIADVFFASFSGPNYIGAIGEGLSHLVGRLQVTSIVVEVMRLSELLQREYAAGAFAPFWMEGLHGISYELFMYGKKTLPVGVAFTGYGSFGNEFTIGDWNVNIGWVSWFIIAPHLAVPYIAYTLLMGLASFCMVKKIGLTESSRDMLWIAWLLYLLPPWFGAFVNFLYAMVVFIAMMVFVRHLPRIEPLRRPALSRWPVK